MTTKQPPRGPIDQETLLLRQILDLLDEDDPREMLQLALTQARHLTGARLGYAALLEPGATEPAWWVATGFEGAELEVVRASISGGVIAEALASGEVVVTHSAIEDPRFNTRRSVRSKRIEAVLCAPVGGAAGPVGVIYLQGTSHGIRFPDASVELLAYFASALAKIAGRVLRHRDATGEDPTSSYRAELELDGIIGRSPALAQVFRDLRRSLRTDQVVLLVGPTGTGKNLVARAIHRNSKRREGPFHELNCAALPENLLESQLFGALRGSHATATRDMPGLFAECQGGTLFLDELTEMSLAAQAKLNHFLESGSYTPLGATRSRTADVRIIAATNRPLEAALADGHLRPDVRQRMQRVIRLPPLEERGDDAVLIASAACAATASAHELGPMSLSLPSRRIILESTWPGNAREVWNVVANGVINAHDEGRLQVEPHDLFDHVHPPEADEAGEDWASRVRQAQRRILREVLEETGGNKSEAARRLGLHRQRIHELIRRLGLTDL